MAEKGLTRRDLEEVFVGFEKRQDEKLKGLEGRVDSRLSGLEERVVDQFHIIAEGLNDQIKLLAEGHAGVVDRLKTIDGRLERIEKEGERQHLETRSLIRLSFA